jgi:glucose-6-phosphate isomerase
MTGATQHPAWQALSAHAKEIAHEHMRDWFEKDPFRSTRYIARLGELELDYSRNRLNDTTLRLLIELAEAMSLPDKILRLYTGHPLNSTENRPALHTALRDQHRTPILIDGENIMPHILEAQEKMRTLVDQVHTQVWRGITQKPIHTVVTIGMGGSILGPVLCCEALKEFAIQPLKHHFISTLDPVMQQDVLEQIDPASTLFIVASKTFTTLETMTNANTLLRWMKERLGEEVTQQHFLAITANQDAALAFGIPEKNIFPMWDWVGGRHSIWSAIGLPLMLLIGSEAFDEFLKGAFEIDQHFKTAPFSENIPVLLALIGVWYTNFFRAVAQAIIPYAYRLRHLPRYLQQLDMESNGKGIDLNHQPITYNTGPVIFGEEGCQGQHTYHQLLHQGQHLIPIDFILIGSQPGHAKQHQDMLIASGLSQAEALMLGKTPAEARAALSATHHGALSLDQLALHQAMPGNRPSNLLFLKALTPKNLGLLLATYEHKIFTQSVIWHINPFDQWGVELGKQLLPHILEKISAT